jgi:hypothetical protein
MSHYIKDIKSLSDFAKSLSDGEMAIAVAEYKNKRYSQLTTATHSLNDAIISEWRVRHGSKPVPRVMPNCEMVLQQNDDNTCKFPKYLL